MTRTLSVVPVVASLILLAACDATSHPPTAPAMRTVPIAQHSAIPADGNGNKQMWVIDITNPIRCANGIVLTRHIEGHVQTLVSSETLQIDAAFEVFTFTNSAGESYVWRTAGGGRAWIENGHVFYSYAGRHNGDIGRTVIDLTTNTVVSETGNEVDIPRLLACAALT